tara:strand:- start:401 stop:688 length:288 start_codon:yes stop_codon:yes gene_type:complete
MKIKKTAIKIYWILLLFLFVSCSTIKDKVYFETISDQNRSNPNKFDLDNIIYRVNKEFLFKLTISQNNQLVNTNIKYIRTKILGDLKSFSKVDPD